MGPLWLARRHIAAGPWRAAAIGLAAAALAGLVLFTLLVVRGAEGSLRLAEARLGADIIAVPQGAEARVESALVMGVPAHAWMPRENVARIAAIPGVAAVSPQLYLSSLARASCCSVSEMFLVAYEPASDFALRPWLDRRLGGGGLGLGEAVGGANVFVPEGEETIRLYGYGLRLLGNLEPTGSNLDRTLFFTFETAEEIARLSHSRAEQPLEIPDGSVSAALVRVAPGSDARRVALAILQEVPGVMPVEGADMFRSFRGQIRGLARAMLGLVTATAGLALLLLALLFAMATGERRREIGVLRALGVPTAGVCASLLAEAGLLAAAGGVAGLALAALVVFLFRGLIVATLQVPFQFPPVASLLALAAAGLAAALAAVMLAALAPALAVSRAEPALAMRE